MSRASRQTSIRLQAKWNKLTSRNRYSRRSLGRPDPSHQWVRFEARTRLPRVGKLRYQSGYRLSSF